LPPLRDRREDILPLAQHFIEKYNEENGRKVSEQIAPDVLALLEAYSWPGNVRELENAIERAVVIAPRDEVSRECLRPEISDPQSVASTSEEGASMGAVQDLGRGINFYDQVRRFEIDLIRRALEQTGGHQSRAARLLGMNATTLNSKIKTYRISLRP
jgi:DNA-binding NtrC family response regulator